MGDDLRNAIYVLAWELVVSYGPHASMMRALLADAQEDYARLVGDYAAAQEVAGALAFHEAVSGG